MSDEIWNEACRESRENNCEGCKSRDAIIQTLSKRIDALEQERAAQYTRDLQHFVGIGAS